MTRTLVAFAFLAAACGDSHTSDAPGPDAGTPDMARLLPDGGGETDAGGPTRCTVTVGERQGEGCFCNGPLALRDGFLYRQSIGIEVYRANGGDLVQLGIVEERGSAQGGLAIVGDHLVSLLDFAEDENLIVYGLSSPATPAPVGGFRLRHDSPIDLAANGSQLVVASRSVDAASLTWLDLSEPTTPREVWTRELEGMPVNVAAGVLGAVVVEERGEPGEQTQWLSWWDDEGRLVDEVELDGRRWGRSVTIREDDAFVTGGPDRTIERFRLGAGFEPMGALDTGSERVGGELLIRGDLAVLSSPILIADVRAPMRELSVIESPIGDMHHLEAPEAPLEWVYGSGGNGVVAARITCE